MKKNNILTISDKNQIDLLSLNKFFIEKGDDELGYLLQLKKYIQPTAENAFKFYLSSLDKDFLHYCKFDDENKKLFYNLFYYDLIKYNITFNSISDKYINRDLIKELITYNKYIYRNSYSKENILEHIHNTKAEKYLDKELILLACKTFSFDEDCSFYDCVTEEYLTKEIYLNILKNQPLTVYEYIYNEIPSDILNDYELLSYFIKVLPWTIFNYKDKNSEEFYLLLKEAVLLDKEILDSHEIPIKFKERLKKEFNLKEYISKEVRKLLKEQIFKNKNYLIKNIK
jgi:hypothetical protein